VPLGALTPRTWTRTVFAFFFPFAGIRTSSVSPAGTPTTVPLVLEECFEAAAVTAKTAIAITAASSTMVEEILRKASPSGRDLTRRSRRHQPPHWARAKPDLEFSES
jgi:hypothetical protein